VIVLKLGGSVVTDKDRRETVDGPALDAAADAVAAHASGSAGRRRGDADPLALVHGGGSFGHPNASDHGVTDAAGSHDVEGLMAIHGAMKALNGIVLRRLHERDVPALPVHPLSGAARDAAGALSYPLATVEGMLGEGFVPVLHGDGVVHAGEGVTVLSGDEIVVRLAEGLDADRVGLCSTVPGVLDADGEVVERISAVDEVADALGGSDATDVTGGMAGKVRALLGLEATAFVFGPDDLAGFLSGADVGTRVD
jgi:isopentenyl phosphate kinase